MCLSIVKSQIRSAVPFCPFLSFLCNPLQQVTSEQTHADCCISVCLSAELLLILHIVGVFVSTIYHPVTKAMQTCPHSCSSPFPPGCQCSGQGCLDGSCDALMGQCVCRSGFQGYSCEQCAPGYFNYPLCQCECLPTLISLNFKIPHECCQTMNFAVQPQ